MSAPARGIGLRGPACAALIALATFANCRTATQIVVSISTNASCGEVMSTTVTATTDPTRMSSMAPSGAKSGCDGDGTIGKVVLVPAGDDDDREVTIMIVTGVGKRAEDCTEANQYAGCIVARRLTRFVPHEVVQLDVHMSLLCKDQPCALGQTCDERTGACVGSQCESPPCDAKPLPDGGTSTPDTSPAADGAVTVDATDDATPTVDASDDASVVEAGSDASALAICQLQCAGGTCRSDGTCVKTCNATSACAGVVCPAGIPCEINCTKMNACNAVSCGAASACVVNCTFKNSCTGVTACAGASTCAVNCTGMAPSCESVDCPRRIDGVCQVDCSGQCGGTVRCCDQGTCDVTPATVTPNVDAQNCQ